MSNNCAPLISIVTVSYNAATTIEQTILSVINQDFEDFEYIIVDGGSTDGTVDIIKKYQDRITLWVSEPDRGIYDAMNKGIIMANGKWVNFMNSGDSFYNLNVLSNLKLDLISDFQVVYGSINCLTKSNSFLLKPKTVEKMNDSMIFCHQAAFVNWTCLNEYKFDIRFKVAADFKFFRSLYISNYRFKEIDVVVANYEAEVGVSSSSFYQMDKEYAIVCDEWHKLNVKFIVVFSSALKMVQNKVRLFLPISFRKFLKNSILNK